MLRLKVMPSRMSRSFFVVIRKQRSLKTIPIPDPQFFTNFGSKSGASAARYSFASL